MLDSLRASTLSNEGLDWFVRYATAISSADIQAFEAMLHEDCEYQVNNLLPFYGREMTGMAMERFCSSIEGLRQELLTVLGTDYHFGVELLHHYLRQDGKVITVPVAAFFDRDEASGLLLSSRVHVDLTPVFAETLP
jgi:hypothetical protein